MSQVSVADMRLTASQGANQAHDLIYAENGADVDTSVDVAGSIQGIEYYAVLALVASLDDDRLFEFFRNKHCGSSGGTQSVDHNIIRQDIQLLLLFSLDVGFPR